jgi:hypothetical protein
VIKVLGTMSSIALPAPDTVVEAGLYYYKDQESDVNTTFFYNGNQIGKFYHHRLQNITFLKADGKWTN